MRRTYLVVHACHARRIGRDRGQCLGEGQNGFKNSVSLLGQGKTDVELHNASVTASGRGYRAVLAHVGVCENDRARHRGTI